MTEERQRLFGTDLRLERRREPYDLRPDRAGDLDLARGDENISQALTLRLRVRKGELAPLGWPTYGSRLHEIIGEPNTQRTRVRLMAYAREAIEADPRVVEVVAISATPHERNVVRLTMEVRLVDRLALLRNVFDFDLEAS
jgi:phage baseplate assembly protein W